MAENLPLYEGLFLMGQAAGADINAATDDVKQILERSQAEVILLRRWDERKLAYAIKGQRRGTYLLALFRVDGVQIANIERDCNLSDEILRVMILRADHMGQIEIDRAIEDSKVNATEGKLREEEGPSSEDTPLVDEPEPLESVE